MNVGKTHTVVLDLQPFSQGLSQVWQCWTNGGYVQFSEFWLCQHPHIHMISIWLLGNQVTLATSCQKPPDHLISFCNLPYWLPQKVSGEACREGYWSKSPPTVHLLHVGHFHTLPSHPHALSWPTLHFPWARLCISTTLCTLHNLQCVLSHPPCTLVHSSCITL